MKKIFLISFFLIFASTACSSKNSELVFTAFDGKVFDLEQKKDKVIVLIFWAEWCGYCRQEMPVLDELYKKYQSRGLEVFGISADGSDKIDKVREIAANFSYPNSIRKYVTKSNFSFPRGFPTSYIIAKGKVVVTFKGYQPIEMFEQQIQPYLN